MRARLRRSFVQPSDPASDVDDCVAEILTRVYASPGWRNVGHGRAHLFTVARNLMIDRARRVRVVAFHTLTEADLLQHSHEPEAALCARDALRRVESALQTLPRQCRTAFVQRRVHGKSVAEIADTMGLSVSTVEKHLVKAVRLMMHAMAEDGEQSGGVRDHDAKPDRGEGRPIRHRAGSE
nr:sigma-70 family RNA polymerase sigma factor [Sphingomonas sp. GM_Shp_1]